MRLWSLHPKYLDAKGLVAVWREGLLALAVLSGKTRGYRNHPQLERFRQQEQPVKAIRAYLAAIHAEAASRGYHFDARKIRGARSLRVLPVTEGQLLYELEHLKRKLRERDKKKLSELAKIRMPDPHPVFHRVAGSREAWEKV